MSEPDDPKGTKEPEADAPDAPPSSPESVARARAAPGGADAPASAEDFELDDIDMRDLMRSALRPPAGSVAPSLLRGVQRRIRKRSRGKFYGDGWSTARSPRSTYLITSLVMLALIAVVFLVLVPWSIQVLP